MMIKKMKVTEKGFTLIELMIVVAIIGILAVIAYPSYRHYIQTTNRKAVIAEMHVISQTLGRYYNNHNGTYATIGDDGTLTANTTINDLATTINGRIKGYAIAVNTLVDGGQAYTITATQDEMGDPECGNLTIDSYDNQTSAKGSNCFR